jgi:4'-phosphopantetheinyl transferase
MNHSGMMTYQSPEFRLTRPNHDTVVVWAARLEVEQAQLDAYTGLLSADERERATRFHFEQHRRRFTAARGILRCLLGGYLNRHPADIRFVYGSAGKPALDRDEGLRFNVAHSHEMALYAFTYAREIGVDIEFMRPVADMEQVAACCFSRREFADWKGLSEAQKPEGFFNGWTRKEAYIKALGEGLSHPLNQFDVSLRPGQAARLLNVQGNPSEAARWSLQAIHPEPGYAAALAVEGQGWTLECHKREK